MVFQRKRDAAWDGKGVLLEHLGASVAVCSKEGSLLGVTPGAEAIFAKAGVALTELPAALPSSLWQAISTKPMGEASIWRPESQADACISCTVYTLGGDHYFLTLQDVSGKQDILSMKLYQQRQEMIGRIVATLAHELRAPLSSILFNIEVLKKQFEALPAERIKELLGEIGAACQLQDRCIHSLIDSAVVYPEDSVNLSEVFDRISAVIHPIFRDKSHSLSINVAKDHHVHGTPMLLEHIFINILKNAAESSRAPVTVTVTSEKIPKPMSDKSLLLTRDHVRILVADTGPGVPSHVRPHIFDPFFSTKTDGNGIGLTLARQAARDLGGDVRLLQSDRGACFEVQLFAGKPPPPKEKSL